MINRYIKFHYKMISHNVFMATMFLAFFLGLASFLLGYHFVFILSAVLLSFFFISQWMMIFLLLFKIPFSKIKQVDFSKGEVCSLKKFSRLTGMSIHSVYALFSLMERTGSVEFFYTFNRVNFDSNPRIGHHQISIKVI